MSGLRAGRVLRWGLAGLGGIVALALLLLVLLLLTSVGARWAISTGLSRLPVPVTIASIGGTLEGPLVLEGIEVRRDSLHARIDRIVLDWRPLELLRRRVVIDSLLVDGVVVDVPSELAVAEQDNEAGSDTATGPPQVPELPVKIVVHDARLGVERVTFAGRGELLPSTLSGSGSLEAFELEATIRGRGGPITEGQFEAHVEGSPGDYQIESQLAFTSADLPPVEGSVSASGSLTALRVDAATLRTASGTADLTADVAWHPEITWEAKATADRLAIAPFTPRPDEWPGEISFRAETGGRVALTGPEATVSVADVSGELRGQPLGGGLEAAVAPGRMELVMLGLEWGSLRVDVSGVVADELDLSFTVDAPDLGVALPEATGAIRAEGRIAGTRSKPQLEAEAEASGVQVADAGVELLTASVRIDAAPGAVSAVEIRATGLRMGEQRVDSATLAGSGTREEHTMSVRAQGEQGRLALVAAGGFADTLWAGRLDSLFVAADDPFGTWSLAEPVEITAAASVATMDTACLARSGSEICASGSWKSGGAVEGAVRLVALPLGLAGPVLPDGLAIEGSLEGAAQFSVTAGGALSADGSLRTEGTIESRLGTTEPQRFELGGDGLEFVIDEAGARGTLAAFLAPQGFGGDLSVEGSAELPGFNSVSIDLESQAVEVRFEARSDDLAVLGAFSPEVEEAEGTVQLVATIGGTVAEPSVESRLEIADGRFVLPEFGLEFREVGIVASGDPETGFDITANVRSGEGRLEVEGSSPAVPSADDPAQLRLTGERFLAMNTPEIQIEIEPDLEIAYDGEITRVDGQVAVPWARIELVEVPPSAISPSPDVVLVDEEEPPPPAVDARVEVIVGDDVLFDGFGFSSAIEGDLEVREEPGKSPIVNGEMRFIEGRFAAYGQNLDIDPGRIVFAGPIADATLEVTALRTATDGTVAGFVVTGSMIEPVVEITSDPAMPDADALSYIMYGKHLNDGDPSQQEQVAGAVATLGVNVVTTKLAAKVGLDEARIEGATKDQAELVAGKYLTPSVFVSYGLGLFKPSNTFRIKYLFNSNWAVQAESGDANGGDLLYQVERGR